MHCTKIISRKKEIPVEEKFARRKESYSHASLQIVFAICVAISFLITDCLGLLIATKFRLIGLYVMGSPLLLGLGCYFVIRNNQFGWSGTLTLGILSLVIVVGNLVFSANAIASV